MKNSARDCCRNFHLRLHSQQQDKAWDECSSLFHSFTDYPKSIAQQCGLQNSRSLHDCLLIWVLSITTKISLCGVFLLVQFSVDGVVVQILDAEVKFPGNEYYGDVMLLQWGCLRSLHWRYCNAMLKIVSHVGI